MESTSAAGDFTEGVVKGIERVGEVLARHFPPKAGDRDELPDTIDEE